MGFDCTRGGSAPNIIFPEFAQVTLLTGMVYPLLLDISKNKHAYGFCTEKTNKQTKKHNNNKKRCTRHSKMRKKCIAAVLRNNFEPVYLLAANKEERRMFSQAIFYFDQKHLLG